MAASRSRAELSYRQIEVTASAARSLHFTSSTPRMKSHPLIAIVPAIAKSATPMNAWEPSGGQRKVSQPSPETIDSTPRKRGRNPDLNTSQPRSNPSNPKKNDSDGCPLVVDLDEGERQRVQLRRLECREIRRSPEQDERRVVEQTRQRLDAAAGQSEDRGGARDASVDGFQQIVIQQGHADLRDHLEHEDREAEPVERLVGENVGRGPRGVVANNQPVADEGLGGDSADDDEQIERSEDSSSCAW